jgi:uncharacterized membrane protein YkoI
MRLRASLLALAIGFTALSGAAEAQRPHRGGGPFGQSWDSDAARDAVRQGRHMPFRDVLRAVQSQVPGFPRGQPILQERGDGRAVYLLRWQTPDGRLLDLVVDAETGAVLR